MKREALISTVEKQLEEIGFKRGQFLWQPRSCQLVVIVGETLRRVTLKAGMTKRALIFEMGRLAGLAEAAGIVARQAVSAQPKIENFKANGARHQSNGAGAFAGMPA